MSFTSNIFLIGIFPWFCLLLYLSRKISWSKKWLIFLADFIFYIWGGVGSFLFAFAFTCMVWLFSRIISKFKNKAIFIGSICLTTLPLVAIKYTSFMIRSVNNILGYHISAPAMLVPIGISFFTFQAISLLCDLRKNVIDEKLCIADVYLYLNFFVTVTSGPIIRFKEFKVGLNATINYANYSLAIERVLIGLCKKMLIADRLSVLANYYFDGIANGGSYSSLGLWIGSVAYSLQLYFDFSGYSDMAIGIGQMLGFEIPENFNNPYCANSISDFWKRWHISLTRWFRDYVYIPLGGKYSGDEEHRETLVGTYIYLICGKSPLDSF